jgi:hypothetical protein
VVSIIHSKVFSKKSNHPAAGGQPLKQQKSRAAMWEYMQIVEVSRLFFNVIAELPDAPTHKQIIA